MGLQLQHETPPCVLSLVAVNHPSRRVVQGFSALLRFFETLNTLTDLDTALNRLQVYLEQHIVGQDLALQQLVSALCDHLSPRTVRTGRHFPCNYL